MTNWMIIALTLMSLTCSAQQEPAEFESKSNVFIENFLTDFNIVETKKEPSFWLSSNCTWSRKVSLKSKKLYLNKYGQKDYKDYTFSFLFYADTDSCAAARKNYLNHYTSDGRPILPDSKGVKRSPVLNIFNENTIVIMELSCEEYEMNDNWKWSTTKALFLEEFATEESEVLENACGTVLSWSNRKDN